ncbi:MAG: JAB domain-containing protein [Candidatus Woesearchaeota archaeon]
MMNLYCWKCGTRIYDQNILGLGKFDNKIGKYKGKSFVAFNCSKCNKTRYQILNSNFFENHNNSPITEGLTDNIDIDQVIDFHKILEEIDTIEGFLSKCNNLSNKLSRNINKPILQPIDVFNLYNGLNSSKLKRLMILTLDKDNYVLSWDFLGEGLNHAITYDPRVIFHTALLLEDKVSVIIAENLRSNFIEPSQKDLFMTKKLIKAGKILGVDFLDHIVIENDSYHSYDQLNYI